MSYYATVDTLPEWQTPSQSQLDAFANEMDTWYQTQKKGRGTRVCVIEKSDAAWLIVRHGGACRRENALEDGEPRMVFYRPEAYDLLIYYHQHGELAICNAGNSVKERRTYCTCLGAAISTLNRRRVLPALRSRPRGLPDPGAEKADIPDMLLFHWGHPPGGFRAPLLNH